MIASCLIPEKRREIAARVSAKEAETMQELKRLSRRPKERTAKLDAKNRARDQAHPTPRGASQPKR